MNFVVVELRMQISAAFSRVLWLAPGALLLLPLMARGQSSGIELEDTVYLQNPNPKAPAGSMYVVWIPKPLESVCSGKTAEQCSQIDFCIRTTTRSISMCQKLALDYAHLPVYRDSRPRRLISITYFPPSTMPGWDKLTRFYASKPKDAFDKLSPAVRFKAKIRFVRAPDDDNFDLLEVLAVSPL